MAEIEVTKKAIMQDNSKDPFRLEGKNLRRVIPQVRRNVEIQHKRMIGHVITFIVCIAFAVLGWRSTGIWAGMAVVFLILSPFSILGFFADRHLKHWHQARLVECQRRLGEDPHEITS